MPGALGDLLLDYIATWSPWFVLAVARPFGFSMIFAVFAWGNISNNMIRMGFVIGLALPLLSADISGRDLSDLALPYLPTLVKELFIGAVLGFFASIPLAIAISSGGILDFYRGAFLGPPDLAGGQSTVLATLFAIIALWFFANLDGFWIVASIIYESYTIWPVQAGFPVIQNGGQAFLMIIERLALGALVLAGPLLLVMFISDLAHLVSSKFGKQINITHMLFSTKNILLALLLPLFLLIAVNAIKRDFEIFRNLLDWATLVLK